MEKLEKLYNKLMELINEYSRKANTLVFTKPIALNKMLKIATEKEIEEYLSMQIEVYENKIKCIENKK